MTAAIDAWLLAVASMIAGSQGGWFAWILGFYGARANWWDAASAALLVAALARHLIPARRTTP